MCPRVSNQCPHIIAGLPRQLRSAIGIPASCDRIVSQLFTMGKRKQAAAAPQSSPGATALQPGLRVTGPDADLASTSPAARLSRPPKSAIARWWPVIRSVVSFIMLLLIAVDTKYPLPLIFYRGPGYSGREPVQPGVVSERLTVPPRILAPPWGVPGANSSTRAWSTQLAVLDAAGVDAMRGAAEVASKALARARELIAPGVTTDEIDREIHSLIIAHLAYPSPLGFQNYSKSVCTSVNEVMVHGIPDSRPLQEGDIVNVDVSVFLDGVHADTSATFAVGQVSDAAKNLLAVTERALAAAVEACGPGKTLLDIGRAVQGVADAAGLITVRQYTGHGIGPHFHSAPRVYAFHPAGWWDVLGWLQLVTAGGQWTPLRPGQAITIEPILVEKGGLPRTKIWADGWTVASIDGALSAQFEHTVVVNDPALGGCEVLTPYWWQDPGAEGPAAAGW